MTDERMRERAQEFLSSRGLADLSLYWPTNKPLPQIDYESGEAKPDLLQLMTAFALSERDAATEQCCKDVCEDCQLNGAPQFINGEFIHPYGMGCGTRCNAAAIRTRVATQGEK